MKFFLPLILTFNFCAAQLTGDKLLHAIVAEGITAGTGYTVYSLSNKMHFGFFFGTLSGIAASGAKEFSDQYFKTGVPDKWDFVSGCFGSIKSGLTLMVEIDIERKHGLKNNYLYYNQ